MTCNHCAPFTDDEMRAKLEELGITTVFKGLRGNLPESSWAWGVPSKAGGIVDYISFSTDKGKLEGPALSLAVLNTTSPEMAARLFKEKSRGVPAEYKPRIRALQKYIDQKLREARRNLPIKPGADLHLQEMAGFPLQDADLSGADLRGAKLYQANLTNANLTNVNLSEAQLRSATLPLANLEQATLKNADLDGANLRDAKLVKADLRNANLDGTNLSNADLGGADLSGASLYGADLAYADLCGADLNDTILDEADLTGVEWDANTVWPPGYPPPTWEDEEGRWQEEEDDNAEEGEWASDDNTD